MAIETSTSTSGRREHRLRQVLGGGSMGKAIAGGLAVVVAALGLARIYPLTTVSIAVILVGVALLFEGATVAAKYREVTSPTEGGETTKVGGALTSEFLGGVAAIVLGVLALIGVSPVRLPAIAAIVLGGSLVPGAGLLSVLGPLGGIPNERSRMARNATDAAAGTQVLAGIAAIVLGVLAVTTAGSPVMLTLIAMISLGTSILFGGAAVTTKLMAAFKY